jgi:type I site-specific restriction endonuclease
LLIEGWDHDQVSCVVVLRPTKIRSLYVQCVGRGTRPISGLIDGVESKEERLRLIAESSKPNLLLLDFIWLTDRLKLISPVDLVAGDRKEVKERMEKKLVEGDLLELEEAAERDMLESLAKEARKHKHKKAKVIDPLSLAVKFNDADLADYEPTMKWEREDVSERQREILARNGIDVTKVICKGHASMILDRIFARQKNGLATVKQVNFLDSLGFQHTDTLSLVEAKQMITEYLTHKKDGTLR